MKQEILRKALDVAPYGLVERPNFNTVEVRQILVEDDSLASKKHDPGLDLLDWGGITRIGHPSVTHSLLRALTLRLQTDFGKR